ncbi:MAG TPA: hypothetical protein VGL29_11105 [Blastocatellia bacterium]
MSLQRYNLTRVISLAAMICVIGLWACRSTKQNLNKPPENPPAPAPVSQSPFDVVDSKVIALISPFDHNRKEHKARTQDCGVCHERPDNDPKPVFQRNGKEHGACIECHNRDFNNPQESKMCIVCHKTPATKESVIEFPTKLVQFGLKLFSHRDHANPEKMKGQMDAEKMPDGAPKCGFCHRFDEQGLKASMPKHPECYSCHIHHPAEKLASCGACHATKPDAMQYTAALGSAFSLYNFKHGPHLKKAACDRCHRTIEVLPDERRADILEINVARGQRHHSTCWTCHVQAKESVCSKCHVSSTPF